MTPARTHVQKKAATESAVPAAIGGILPSRTAFADPRGPFLFPTLLLLIARALGWIGIPFASEDAYITFRFAQNFATGNGLVFNPGERVFGYSSPVWTVWNAIGIRLFHDPLYWAKGWSIVADIVVLLVTGQLLVRHSSRASAWCFTFFFAAWPFFSAVCASGMEMDFMLALVVVAAALTGRGSPAAGPVLGLLALTRPEGVATAALIAIGARWRDRAIAAVLFVAGVAALWSYYGSPIPQSVVAKSAIYGTPGPWAGRHWWDWISPLVIGMGPALNDTAYLTVLRLLMFPAAIAGVAILWKQRTSGLALATWALLLVWVGYSLVGVAYFYWYLAIPLAGIALAASVGFPVVIRGRVVPITVALFCVSLWTLAQDLYRTRAIAEYETFGQVANFLIKNCQPGQSIMLEPIGIIGFATPMRVIDEVGLVSPYVAVRRRAGSGWYTDVAEHERPDWLVIRLGVVRTGNAFAGAGTPFRNLAERDSLFSHYEHVFTAQKDAGDNAMLVFRRR